MARSIAWTVKPIFKKGDHHINDDPIDKESQSYQTHRLPPFIDWHCASAIWIITTFLIIIFIAPVLGGGRTPPPNDVKLLASRSIHCAESKDANNYDTE